MRSELLSQKYSAFEARLQAINDRLGQKIVIFVKVMIARQLDDLAANILDGGASHVVIIILAVNALDELRIGALEILDGIAACPIRLLAEPAHDGNDVIDLVR